jgi:hypothetical protein
LIVLKNTITEVFVPIFKKILACPINHNVKKKTA